MDTGFELDHEELGGRLSLGPDFTPPRYLIDSFHGTAVAGTIGSNTYGAAKKAQMIGITVPTRGNGIFKGIMWSISDIMSKKRSGRAVINVSLCKYGTKP